MHGESDSAAEAARDAMSQAASYGSYFVVRPGRFAVDGLPLAQLLSPARLKAQVSATAAALGVASAGRVAASTWHLGLMAQLTSPVLGAAVRAGVPDVRPSRVWTRPGGGPRQIAMEPSALLAQDGAALARVVERLADPVCLAVAQGYAVSRRVLWGNVAASLTGAARVIAAVRPEDGPAARSLAAAALDRGMLRGTVDEAGFRRSCCLFYQAPGAGYCGDCVLATRRADSGRAGH